MTYPLSHGSTGASACYAASRSSFASNRSISTSPFMRFVTIIPNSYTIGISDMAYINNKIALKWIKYFNFYTQSRTKGAYRLFILNGYDSYKTLEFTQYCINQKILLAFFPLHLIYK